MFLDVCVCFHQAVGSSLSMISIDSFSQWGRQSAIKQLKFYKVMLIAFASVA